MTNICLLDFASSLGRGLDTIERGFTIFFGIIILLQVVFVVVGLFRRTTGYHAFLRVYGIIPVGLAVLCFQHEMGHYIQGSMMIVLTILSVLLSFRKIG